MTDALKPPPIGRNPDAIEVARVWYLHPGESADLTFRADLKHPRAWGVILAEMTRQLVKAYVGQGMSQTEAIDAIHGRYNAAMHQHFPAVFPPGDRKP